MPVTVTEKWESREQSTGKQAAAELLYVVEGANDNDDIALAAAEALIPLTFKDLNRQSIRLERVAHDAWEATAAYGSDSGDSGGGSSLSIDTSGGTQHITHSLATIARYAESGATAPDHKGAIGVTEDNVEGVDIQIPVFNVTVTKSFPVGSITESFLLALFNATGKTNSAPFIIQTSDGARITFAVGECLFQGATISNKSNENWELSYKFAGSKNVTGLAIGAITGIEKKGWEYLWVEYERTVDQQSHARKPKAVHIEKVYEATDLSTLGV